MIRFGTRPCRDPWSYWLILVISVSAGCLALPSLAQAPTDNSNLWPVHRDNSTGFRISHPPTWVIVAAKGPNVRFSVSPPDGPGNCNVVAARDPELQSFTQSALNREIEAFPMDHASWAELLRIPRTHVRVLEARQARIHDVPAALAILETRLENLEGRYLRKQVVAVTFTPGLAWSLNCGVSTFAAVDARSRFSQLQPTFNKILGSFALVK
jgi:hypothetical protein